MEVIEINGRSTGRGIGINQIDGNRWNKNIIKEELKRIGLFEMPAWEKFIPKEYLYAPVEDRVSLLQGLIDTDGEVTDYRLSYSTSSITLANDLEFLVQSLGGVTRRGIKEKPFYKYKGNVVIGKPSYRISIQIPDYIVPTRVKPWRVRKSYHPNRVIVDIEEIGRSEVVGISVSANDQLYLTEKCIVTHNCGKGKQYINVDPDTGQTLEEYWGIVTTKYDPGVQKFARHEPEGKFDLVICVQVLGSIPRDDLTWVVDRLYSFATKAIFVSERLAIPRKQIYASMADDMPHGLSREDWLTILHRPVDKPKMIVALKGTDIQPGWNLEEV